MKEATGEIWVSLSYPTSNHEGGKTDENGRYVSLTIEDENSGTRMIRLDLSAQEFTQILAGQITRIKDGITVSEHLDRVGKLREHDKMGLGRVSQEQAVANLEAMKPKLQAEGWTNFNISSHNYGRDINMFRWVKPSA